MKNKILAPLAFAALLLASNNANAQAVSTSYKGQDTTVSKDTLAQLTLFTGQHVDGKTYLHWDMQGEQCHGLYIVYRSFDGMIYEVLGMKRGIGVPVETPISYYFQDENPPVGTTYYKLVHIAQNKTYLISDNIAVTREEMVLSSKNND